MTGENTNFGEKKIKKIVVSEKTKNCGALENY